MSLCPVAFAGHTVARMSQTSVSEHWLAWCVSQFVVVVERRSGVARVLQPTGEHNEAAATTCVSLFDHRLAVGTSGSGVLFLDTVLNVGNVHDGSISSPLWVKVGTLSTGFQIHEVLLLHDQRCVVLASTLEESRVLSVWSGTNLIWLSLIAPSSLPFAALSRFAHRGGSTPSTPPLASVASFATCEGSTLSYWTPALPGGLTYARHEVSIVPELRGAEFVAVEHCDTPGDETLALTTEGFLILINDTTRAVAKWMDCKVLPATGLAVDSTFIVVLGSPVRFFDRTTWEFRGKLRPQNLPAPVAHSFLSGLQRGACIAGRLFVSPGLGLDVSATQPAERGDGAAGLAVAGLVLFFGDGVLQRYVWSQPPGTPETNAAVTSSPPLPVAVKPVFSQQTVFGPICTDAKLLSCGSHVCCWSPQALSVYSGPAPLDAISPAATTQRVMSSVLTVVDGVDVACLLPDHVVWFSNQRRVLFVSTLSTPTTCSDGRFTPSRVLALVRVPQVSAKVTSTSSTPEVVVDSMLLVVCECGSLFMVAVTSAVVSGAESPLTLVRSFSLVRPSGPSALAACRHFFCLANCLLGVSPTAIIKISLNRNSAETTKTEPAELPLQLLEFNRLHPSSNTAAPTSLAVSASPFIVVDCASSSERLFLMTQRGLFAFDPATERLREVVLSPQLTRAPDAILSLLALDVASGGRLFVAISDGVTAWLYNLHSGRLEGSTTVAPPSLGIKCSGLSFLCGGLLVALQPQAFGLFTVANTKAPLAPATNQELQEETRTITKPTILGRPAAAAPPSTLNDLQMRFETLTRMRDHPEAQLPEESDRRGVVGTNAGSGGAGETELNARRAKRRASSTTRARPMAEDSAGGAHTKTRHHDPNHEAQQYARPMWNEAGTQDDVGRRSGVVFVSERQQQQQQQQGGGFADRDLGAMAAAERHLDPVAGKRFALPRGRTTGDNNIPKGPLLVSPSLNDSSCPSSAATGPTAVPAILPARNAVADTFSPSARGPVASPGLPKPGDSALFVRRREDDGAADHERAPDAGALSGQLCCTVSVSTAASIAPEVPERRQSAEGDNDSSLLVAGLPGCSVEIEGADEEEEEARSDRHRSEAPGSRVAPAPQLAVAGGGAEAGERNSNRGGSRGNDDDLVRIGSDLDDFDDAVRFSGDNAASQRAAHQQRGIVGATGGDPWVSLRGSAASLRALLETCAPLVMDAGGRSPTSGRHRLNGAAPAALEELSQVAAALARILPPGTTPPVVPASFVPRFLGAGDASRPGTNTASELDKTSTMSAASFDSLRMELAAIREQNLRIERQNAQILASIESLRRDR